MFLIGKTRFVCGECPFGTKVRRFPELKTLLEGPDEDISVGRIAQSHTRAFAFNQPRIHGPLPGRGGPAATSAHGLWRRSFVSVRFGAPPGTGGGNVID